MVQLMLMLMLMLALAKLTKLLTVLYCPAIVHLNMPVHQGVQWWLLPS